MDRDVTDWVWRNDSCLSPQAAAAHISKMAVTKKTLRPPLNIIIPIMDVIKARLTDDMMKTYNFLIDEIVLNLLANVNKVDNEMQ
nr:hypothetical protein [Tanacetum cinerariifolium]